jgi:spore maturation protein CgeB
MHQRLVEGSLAGGFFLINRLRSERDGGPIHDYFEEGREVVLFDSADDLLEKCRYYLAHEEERQAIAKRMRERALRQYTLEKAARTVLETFRRRVQCLADSTES